MSFPIFKSAKVCAKCRFWNGERIIDDDKVKVHCPSVLSPGICTNKKSVYKTRSMAANHLSCSHYELWDKIKL